MAILIKGGRIITDSEDRIADVYAEGETITRIAQDIDPKTVPDADVIDATGKYVFPGFIDPHVHIHLPFMGTNAIDDHASASRAALVGGTTSLIEMICPGPDDEPQAAFDEWLALAKGDDRPQHNHTLVIHNEIQCFTIHSYVILTPTAKIRGEFMQNGSSPTDWLLSTYMILAGCSGFSHKTLQLTPKVNELREIRIDVCGIQSGDRIRQEVCV